MQLLKKLIPVAKENELSQSRINPDLKQGRVTFIQSLILKNRIGLKIGSQQNAKETFIAAKPELYFERSHILLNDKSRFNTEAPRGIQYSLYCIVYTV